MVVVCLRDNLSRGVAAKASFILGLDPVAFVYALDGSFVSIEGYYLDGDELFTEYRCRDVQVTSSSTCAQAEATECERVRDW